MPSTSNNGESVTTPKKRKGKVSIVLEKAGNPPITVNCSAKIKQNPALVLLTMRTSGFPPLNVTPKDWKGFGIHIVAFLSIFLFAATSQVIGGIGLVLALIDLVLNCILEANYYFNFIKKKIKEGYSIADSEQRALCEQAGMFGKK